MIDEVLGTKEGGNSDGIQLLWPDPREAARTWMQPTPRYIVKACRERGLAPIIKLKASSTTRGKGAGDTWDMAARDQLGRPARNRTGGPSHDEKRRTQDVWKRVRYGRRWPIEIIFSAFKDMFGELPHSPKWRSMVQEVRIKAVTHNKLMEMEAGIAQGGQTCAPLGQTERAMHKLV